MEQIGNPQIQELKTRIENEYVRLRGLVQSHYLYNSTPAHDKAFKKAAEFCKLQRITPEQYAMGLFQSLSGHQENFYPSYFGSASGNQAALTYSKEYCVHPSDLYEHQKEMLRRHVVDLGKDPIETLLNPRLSFYAWFRILATKEPVPEIIRLYSETAKKEASPELVAFLCEQNLSVNRII